MQGVRQDHVLLGDELVAQAGVVRVEVDELVLDHLPCSFLARTTRRRGFSSFERSTLRGTFSTTFHGLASLPLVPHLRREPSWISCSAAGRARGGRFAWRRRGRPVQIQEVAEPLDQGGGAHRRASAMSASHEALRAARAAIGRPHRSRRRSGADRSHRGAPARASPSGRRVRGRRSPRTRRSAASRPGRRRSACPGWSRTGGPAGR